ncbi:Uncharacterised protein [Raoultella terrigena]|uniref:Uncharacterized protein n=1 Tax=Raoultella terrigena TaxID=577 RepID=A0A3P8JNN7_RAOTE|nr:Uncharacterised protein [Raoultella terrigena]
MSELTLGTTLSALVLCGMAGMVGQGIRAIVGLRKAGYLQIEAGDSKQNFSGSYLMVTLMIGFYCWQSFRADNGAGYICREISF